MSQPVSFRFSEVDSAGEDDTDSDGGYPSAGEMEVLEAEKKPKSSAKWLYSIFSRKTHHHMRLSVQSGDIQRSPTEPGIALIPATFPTGDRAEFMDTPDSPRVGVGSEDEEKDPRTRNGFLFDLLHKLVKMLFFSIKTRCCVIPIISLAILAGNVLFIGTIAAVSIMKFPPQVNLNIESFGIPSHESQVNWDAYTAAESGQFDSSNPQGTGNSDSSIELRRRSNGELQPRSTSQPGSFPNCPPQHDTQKHRHKYWMLDLVFRVPALNTNRNILTLDHIKYIHQIEETLYNSSGYQNFCLKSNGVLCDPLVSLLTWLYIKDHSTGKYVYNTADHLPQDISKTLSSRQEVLWFTGGELDYVNSTYTAQLLRSQMRIGVPLPCFSLGQRTREQQELVTDYLVSLIPILKNMSNR